MGVDLIPLPAILVVVAASTTMLIILGHQRWLLTTLLAQYAALLWLAQGPYGIAVGMVKALAGALTVLILWLSVKGIELPSVGDGDSLVDRGEFRAVAGLVALLTGFGLNRAGLIASPHVSPEAALAGTWLLTSGLIQIGLFARPLRVGVGLLTFLSGFEIFYSALEPSLAVAALLAGVHLGLGLIMAYLSRSQTWGSGSGAQGDMV